MGRPWFSVAIDTEQNGKVLMDLQQKVGLITGGTSGIGLESAKRAFAAGMKAVAITGQNPERLEAAARELSALGEVLPLRWRAEELGDAALVPETVKKEFGSLDFVFANAGVCWGTPLGGLDGEAVQKQLLVNFTAPLVLLDGLIPLVSDGGSIILTTSCINQLGVPGYAAYSASKAALRSLARTMSAELLERRIRVNAIAPGPVATPIHSKIGLEQAELDDLKKQVASMVPLNRFGTTDEVVDAVVFLASDSSRFVLGEEIAIDGGWTNL